MFEGYFKRAEVDEGRRAFVLDCVLRAIGEEGKKLTEGKDWLAKRIFENYLKGQE